MSVSISTCFALLLYFCNEHYLTFLNIKEQKGISEKQQAYILSIKSSLVLFIFSVLFNYKFIVESELDLSKYLTSSTKSDHYIQTVTVLYLISYLLMDTILGYTHYHKYMKTLSGYPHHIIYIIACLCSFQYEWYQMFCLFLVAELPTFILGIGSYNKAYRNNNLFGVTFLATRILYHMFLIYKMSFNDNFNSLRMMSFAFLTLGVHSYWFYKWIKKYAFSQKPKDTHVTS